MSRTNTAAYESIKASQIVFQNPDRTFPAPGAVLAIDNLRGATTWSRNLDIDSVALSGSSSTGVLTYDNQLLVNGVPVGGGGGSDVSGGSNIRVDLSSGVHIVSLDVQEDINMNSKSIENCKTITLPRIPNTSSAKITLGNFNEGEYGIASYEVTNSTFLLTTETNVEVRGSNGVIMIGAMGISGETIQGKSITNVVKTGYSTKASSMELNAANTFVVGATDISSADPTLVLRTDLSQGSISVDRNGAMRLTAGSYAMNAVPSGSLPNVLGYDIATGAVRYQAAGGGGSDLSGGYNISVNSGAVNMNITQPVLMNNNPVVNASYVDISNGGDSGTLSYSSGLESFISSKHITISGISNPYLRLQGSGGAGTVTYDDSLKETTIYGKNINLYSDNGSYYVSNNNGLTMSSQTDQRVWINVANSGVIKSSLYLSNNNELIIGDLQISANPILKFQGGKAAQSNLDTAAQIEYFDASGVEQLRFTSKNYAFNAVPAGLLPTVLGYDTSTGEIKHQAITGGLSPLTSFTYDSSGALTPSGGVSLGTFTAPASGIYSINFIITLANDSSTFIRFDNLSDSFNLVRTKSTPAPSIVYPPLKLSGIQTRPPSSPQTAVYSTTILESLSSGTSYIFGADNENPSGSCTWASCIAEVRIIRLC
jgi:hypothetical protein